MTHSIPVRQEPSILMSVSIIAADFDRARQEMLAAFRELVKAHPHTAQSELRATQEAMRQLLVLEGVPNA